LEGWVEGLLGVEVYYCGEEGLDGKEVVLMVELVDQFLADGVIEFCFGLEGILFHEECL
jgi:hypothetical protein